MRHLQGATFLLTQCQPSAGQASMYDIETIYFEMHYSWVAPANKHTWLVIEFWLNRKTESAIFADL
jgi:hypothetical protein